MLNQCILIGRITEIRLNEEGVVDKVTIDVTTGATTDKIAIYINQKMASYGLFKRGGTIAVKAKISSNDTIMYHIIAERITVLGGSSHES